MRQLARQLSLAETGCVEGTSDAGISEPETDDTASTASFADLEVESLEDDFDFSKSSSAKDPKECYETHRRPCSGGSASSRASSHDSRAASGGQWRNAGGKQSFSEAGLAGWFREHFDARGVGQVPLRDFLAALRQNVSLQVTLCEAAGIRLSDEERRSHFRLRGDACGPALSVEAHSDALLMERGRIKRVFQAMSGTESGVLDWPAFLGFFRARGLLQE